MQNVFKILTDICYTIPSHPTVVCGYWTEVRNSLAQMGYDKSKDGTKYPLIIINTNVVFKDGDVLYNGVELDGIRFYLVCQADLKENFAQKMENRYESIIFPLFDEMIETFELSNKIRFYNKKSMKTIECEKTLYPYLNTNNKDQNQIYDIVDAMEVKFKDFKLKNL